MLVAFFFAFLLYKIKKTRASCWKSVSFFVTCTVGQMRMCVSLVICIQTIGCGFLFNSTLPCHDVHFTVQPNSGCQAHKRSVGSTTRYTVNFTKESLLSIWHLAVTCPNCRPQLVSRASCSFQKYENEIRLASGLD